MSDAAQRVMDLSLKLIDDLMAEKVRDSLYDHPACQDVATHGYTYRPAVYRYDEHGCGAGFQCWDCAAAAASRFGPVLQHFGYVTCRKCSRRFASYTEFVTVEEM